MSQQIEVLDRLLKFYSKRYEGSTLESKMQEATQDLIDSSDINLAAAMKFFTENGIEPKLKAKKVSSSYSDPCGGGGYNRSYC